MLDKGFKETPANGDWQMEIVRHETGLEFTLTSNRQPGFGYLTVGKSLSESNPLLICIWYWKHPTRKGETQKIELGPWKEEYLTELEDYLVSQAMIQAMKLGFGLK